MRQNDQSGQTLLFAVIILMVLAILGYAALELGGQTESLTYSQAEHQTAKQLGSLAVQAAIQWGNTNISFPPGIPTTIPAFFKNDACTNGAVGCGTPLTSAQVADSSNIWSTANTVPNNIVAPLATSLPGATVKWVMEYYGNGLCTVPGCTSSKAPTNLCRCYYYRVTALTTNDPTNPQDGLSVVTQTLYRIPQSR